MVTRQIYPLARGAVRLLIIHTQLFPTRPAIAKCILIIFCACSRRAKCINSHRIILSI